MNSKDFAIRLRGRRDHPINVLAGVLVVLFATACGASGATSEPSAVVSEPTTTALASAATVGTLTWGDDGCSADLGGAVTAGRSKFDLVNDSDGPAAFHLWKLAPSASYEEFSAFIDSAIDQIAGGDTNVPPPDYLSGLIASRDLAGGESDTLEARLEAGRYVLVCLGESTPRSGAHIAGAAGPIEVGPSASTPTDPVARGYAMMADLPGEPGVVLLGGATRPGPIDLSDMWTFATEAGWREITPAALPELTGFAPLTGTAFAFDTKSGLAVFVDIEGNPWTYDVTTNRWANKPSGAGPTALLGAAMAYDSRADRMIVFGGYDLATSSENNETWAYDLDSSTWERRHPQQSPSPRNFSVMAYDAASDRVILFGGAPASGVLGDTWAYNYESDTWTEMSPPTSPPARTYSGMVYDPKRDRMILFGGSEDTETASLGDVWEYDLDSNRWTDVSPADGPGARAWHAMAYDDESGVIVAFGGGESRTAYTAETWLLDPTARSWRQAE